MGNSKIITTTKIGKTPEFYGIPSSYRKCFEGQHLQPLESVLNYILQGSVMPESWKEANTALLLKEQDLI